MGTFKISALRLEYYYLHMKSKVNDEIGNVVFSSCLGTFGLPCREISQGISVSQAICSNSKMAKESPIQFQYTSVVVTSTQMCSTFLLLLMR